MHVLCAQEGHRVGRTTSCIVNASLKVVALVVPAVSAPLLGVVALPSLLVFTGPCMLGLLASKGRRGSVVALCAGTWRVGARIQSASHVVSRRLQWSGCCPSERCQARARATRRTPRRRTPPKAERRGRRWRRQQPVTRTTATTSNRPAAWRYCTRRRRAPSTPGRCAEAVVVGGRVGLSVGWGDLDVDRAASDFRYSVGFQSPEQYQPRDGREAGVRRHTPLDHLRRFALSHFY